MDVGKLITKLTANPVDLDRLSEIHSKTYEKISEPLTVHTEMFPSRSDSPEDVSLQDDETVDKAVEEVPEEKKVKESFLREGAEVLDQKNFGEWDATVTRDGKIKLEGDYNSNYGHFYPHMFQKLKDGEDVQVVGMDWEAGMTSDVLSWLKSLVKSGKLDHLVSEEEVESSNLGERDEENVEESQTYSKDDAIEELEGRGIDFSSDFFQLRSSEVDEILDVAKKYKYRKPQSASGSKGRYFYQMLKRHLAWQEKERAKQDKNLKNRADESNGGPEESNKYGLLKPFDGEVEITGARWFQKSSGNTYHSVKVTDDSGVVVHTNYAYGYDNAYLQTAHKLLQDAGYFAKTGERKSSGIDADYSRFIDWLRNENIDYRAENVSRKRDLIQVSESYDIPHPSDSGGDGDAKERMEEYAGKYGDGSEVMEGSDSDMREFLSYISQDVEDMKSRSWVAPTMSRHLQNRFKELSPERADQVVDEFLAVPVGEGKVPDMSTEPDAQAKDLLEHMEDTWELRAFVVGGNEEDGWQVNDTRTVDSDVPVSDEQMEDNTLLVDRLKEVGFFQQDVRADMVEFDIQPERILISDMNTGQPVGEMVLTKVSVSDDHPMDEGRVPDFNKEPDNQVGDLMEFSVEKALEDLERDLMEMIENKE